jgi:hypothetical protein
MSLIKKATNNYPGKGYFCNFVKSIGCMFQILDLPGLAPIKGFQTTGEAASPPKNIQYLKHEISSFFSFLLVIFAFLDQETQTN